MKVANTEMKKQLKSLQVDQVEVGVTGGQEIPRISCVYAYIYGFIICFSFFLILSSRIYIWTWKSYFVMQMNFRRF